MTTISYPVKRQLRDAVVALISDGGGPLGEYRCTYGFRPGRQEKRHIYFGGVRSTQRDDATAGQNNTLVFEEATVTMYIRVVLSIGAVDEDQDPVEEAERIAETAGDAFGQWLGMNRDFAGHGTHAKLAFTMGDYSETDTEAAAVLAYAVTVAAYLDLTQRIQGGSS